MPVNTTKKKVTKRGTRGVPKKPVDKKTGNILQRNEDLIRNLNRQYSGDKIDGYMGNLNLPTDKSVFDYDKDRIEAIQKSCEDIVFFAESFFYIISLDEGKQLIKLHDFQKEILKMFMDNRKNIVCTSRQIGKALALDTPVPTPNGWTTMGELNDGDIVYDNYGNPTKVIKAWDIMYDRPCYELTFDNGEKIVADEGHLWFTQIRNDRNPWKGGHCNGNKKTTKEIKDTLYYGKEPNHRIKKCFGVDGNTQNLNIDPYLLGYWLGDGYSDGSRIIIGKDDVENILNILNLENYSINKDRNNNSMVYIKNTKNYSLSKTLKVLNLYKNKHIPEIYKQASKEQRLELVKGLMDSDGTVTHSGSCQITLSNKKLLDDFNEILLSLGYKTSVKPKLMQKDSHLQAYNLNFKPHDIVFKLKRKKEKQKLPCNNYDNRINYHYIKEIKEVPSVPVRCITVDSDDAMFLCGKTYIPTSNTTLMCIYAMWLVTFFEYQRIVIVANKEKTAKTILERIKLAYEELPAWIKPSVEKGGWSKESINFGNGSTVSISSTSADAIRGQAVSVILLDEMAFIDDGIVDAFWSAVYPTISSSKKSKVLIASTPNGVGNKFHSLWEEALENKNGFNPYKVTWREVPGKTEEWAEAEKLSLGSEELFLQEYECEFLQSSQSPIAEDLYQALLQKTRDPEIVLDDGKFKIWERPNLEDNVYVAGCDTSEGVGMDNAVLHIFDLTDLTNIKQVAQYASNIDHPHNFSKKINDILKIWGKPPLCLERNGSSGGMVVESMVNIHHYPNIVDFERGTAVAHATKSHLRGIKANNTTKAPSIINMFYYLKERRVVELADIETLKELRTFVRIKSNIWGKSSDKFKDDRIDALTWALVVLDPKLVNQYYIVEMEDVNGRPMNIKRGYQVYTDKKIHDDYNFLFPNIETENQLASPYVMNGTHQISEMGELISMGWIPVDQHLNPYGMQY